MRTTEVNRWRWRLLVALAAALAVAHALRAFQSVVSDDAFIAFRYARNLARGFGLVWNTMESPLEGFSSLLHVLLLAGGIRLGVDPLPWSQLLGLCGAALACVGSALLARELSADDDRASLLAAFGLAAAPPLAAWARGGLETTLFTGVLALAVWAWLRERRRGAGRVATSLAFFAAALARPEGFGIACLALGFDCAGRLGSSRSRSAALRAARGWWPLALLVAAYLAWKLLYFGALLPNTYHAKAGGEALALRSGLGYALRFFRDYGALNLLLAAVPLAALRQPRPAAAAFLVSTVGVYAAYVVKIGGDYQYFARYLVPVLPPLVALSAHGAVQLWDSTRRWATGRRLAVTLPVALLALLQLGADSLRELRDRPFLLTRPWRLVEPLPAPGDPFASRYRDDYRVMGQALKRHFPGDRTLASIAVGAIGYYSEMPILDLLGINDARIARLPVDVERYGGWTSGHMKGSAAELLRRAPDYALLDLRLSERPGAEPAAALRRKYPFVDDLLRSAEFREAYVLESCALGDGRWLNVFRNVGAPRPDCVGDSKRTE